MSTSSTNERTYGEASARALLTDAALALGLSAIALAATGSMVGADGRLAALLTLGLTAPVALQRAVPVLAYAIATLAGIGQIALLPLPTVGAIAVPVLVYSLARWSGGGLGGTALATALGGAIVGPLAWVHASSLSAAPILVTTIAASAGFVTVAYVLGALASDRADRARQRTLEQAERHRLELAEQEQRSRAAVAEERTLIAREIHDVVAHSLAMVVVQAEGGRAIAERQPDRAVTALTDIADVARSALEEMREMVALLRRGAPAVGETDPSSGYLPTPGLAGIPELVTRTGERVRLQVDGVVPEVGPMVALAAYRIVQESLTNVLRHAGPTADATVHLAYSPSRIEVTVTDDGYGAAARSDGRGHGLATMSERAHLLGGELTYGPRAGGGFTVHAVLPTSTPPDSRGRP